MVLIIMFHLHHLLKIIIIIIVVIILKHLYLQQLQIHLFKTLQHHHIIIIIIIILTVLILGNMFNTHITGILTNGVTALGNNQLQQPLFQAYQQQPRPAALGGVNNSGSGAVQQQQYHPSIQQ
eukprot:UN10080